MNLASKFQVSRFCGHHARGAIGPDHTRSGKQRLGADPPHNPVLLFLPQTALVADHHDLTRGYFVHPVVHTEVRF